MGEWVEMMNGKGSRPRPVVGARYRRNFDDIFRRPVDAAAKLNGSADINSDALGVLRRGQSAPKRQG